MQADLAHRVLILTNNLDRFSACAYFRRLSRPWQLIPLAMVNTIISPTKSMGRTYSYSRFGGANAHVPYVQVEPANFVRHTSGHQLVSGTITHANCQCFMMGDRKPLMFVRTTDETRACWHIFDDKSFLNNGTSRGAGNPVRFLQVRGKPNGTASPGACRA
jgi:hypothetical protein